MGRVLMLLTMSSAEFLILMKYSLPIVSFMDCGFGVVTKKSSPCSRLSRFLPALSRIFVVLCFTLWSMINFELICERYKVCLDFFFFTYRFQLFWHHLLKRLVLLWSFVKDWLPIFVGVYFWGRYLFHWSVCSVTSTALSWSCSLTVSLEVGCIIVLATVIPLLLHINFRIILLISTEEFVGIFMWTALNLQISLWRTDILTIMNLPIH